MAIVHEDRTIKKAVTHRTARASTLCKLFIGSHSVSMPQTEPANHGRTSAFRPGWERCHVELKRRTGCRCALSICNSGY
jgi:hypothetical protein